MSSRLKPKVIWVRSLVPKEKNSASSAILSAVRAARGISIIVPTMYSTSVFFSFMTSSAVATTSFFMNSSSRHGADERDHDLGQDLDLLLLDVDGGLDDGAGLHVADLRVGDRQAAAAVARASG